MSENTYTVDRNSEWHRKLRDWATKTGNHYEVTIASELSEEISATIRLLDKDWEDLETIGDIINDANTLDRLVDGLLADW
jgi:hypothetical protein